MVAISYARTRASAKMRHMIRSSLPALLFRGTPAASKLFANRAPHTVKPQHRQAPSIRQPLPNVSFGFARSRVARIVAAILALLPAAQTATAQSSSTDFDECGTLVRKGGCVVFQGAGDYTLSDYGRFNAGDFVRVTGTLDEDCPSICDNVDGCIRGAVVYDALIVPCGTSIPTPSSALGDLCTASSGILAGLGFLGLAFIGHRAARRP